MNSNQLRETLNKLKERLNITESIRIELKPMKTRAASISLKKNTIRINKNLVALLDNECIEYLILHELTHYKLKTTYHDSMFYKELNKWVSPAKAKELERKILTSLLKLNHIL